MDMAYNQTKDMLFISLTIEYLNKCNLRCAHCAVKASPEMSDKVELGDAKNWITMAKKHGANEISVCGGEPFLVFDELCELAKHSSSLGSPFVTFSNAFWAQTPEKTRKYLAPLKKNGLAELHLSFDCFHLMQGIPLQNFRNVALVADEIGLKLVLNVLRTKKNEITPNFIKRNFKNYGMQVQYTPLRMLGRAANLDRKIFVKEEKDEFDKGCMSPGLLISPRGEAYACCGAFHLANSANPLRLGNAYASSFLDIIERYKNLKLLLPLVVFGPSFINKIIGLKEKEILRDSYFSCEFCCKLLNSEKNVRIINEMFENPTQNLKMWLKIAEMYYENKHRVQLSRFNSPLAKFCRNRFPAAWSLMARVEKNISKYK